MQLLKLSVLSLSLFAFVFSFSSCEKESEKKKVTEYVKSGIVMSFAQETPAAVQTPSAAIGSLDVFYSKASKVLQYKATWNGLTGNPTAMHVHGLAPIGYAAGIVQNILTAPNPTLFPVAGTYSGFFLVDGVKIKEEDLLNGLYYVNIHTTLNPSGEIRGQIRFQ
jgi:hypothetical protein